MEDINCNQMYRTTVGVDMTTNQLLSKYGFTKNVNSNGMAEVYMDGNLVYIGRSLDVHNWILGLKL